MNRYPYRKGKKKRPTLDAIIEHRPPHPGRTRGGIGWEYVYPAPPPCRHEYPEPCDPPAPYAAVRTKAKPNGKAP
jgi:hypothetical protein